MLGVLDWWRKKKISFKILLNKQRNSIFSCFRPQWHFEIVITFITSIFFSKALFHSGHSGGLLKFIPFFSLTSCKKIISSRSRELTAPSCFPVILQDVSFFYLMDLASENGDGGIVEVLLEERATLQQKPKKRFGSFDYLTTSCLDMPRLSRRCCFWAKHVLKQLQYSWFKTIFAEHTSFCLARFGCFLKFPVFLYFACRIHAELQVWSNCAILFPTTFKIIRFKRFVLFDSPSCSWRLRTEVSK